MSRRAVHLAGLAMLLGALASGSGSAWAGESCTIDGCTSAAQPSARLGAVLLDDAARQAIGQAVRAAAVAPASASALMSSSRQASSTSTGGDAWDRQLGRDPGREAYNCVLGFGIGGALARDGFVGTRALGRTQVWRDGQKP
ncbi:MAG: hypothetical protein ACJ8HI_01975 [Massilia sp.]